ncbi:MAG: helicase-exonuclease AddAB subunit AddA [Clostridiales bacterium]|nr:helicase-exonuclease AddAB subunit AddA [Clostridiales bacterium]
MANMTWTEQQRKVIDVRNRNILVSAAAGSGKTAVLVERIIEKITSKENPINIDQLLIVTFTKAAAGEMRERIGKAIEKKVLEEPDNTHLQKQMTLLYNAQITTIDSFCLYVIRNYFHTIDLDPSFRIADEAELTLLRSDVIAELLEERYEEGNEEFLNFVECYSASKSDEPIEDLILKLYQFSMSYPYPEEWLSKRIEDFEITTLKELNESEWMKDLIYRIKLLLNDARRINQEALSICVSPNGPEQYMQALTADQEILDSLYNITSYEGYYEALGNLSFARLSTKKVPDVDEEKKELVKNLRNQCKDLLKDLSEDYFYQSPEEMIADMTKVAKPMAVLIDLVQAFSVKLREAKEESNLVDFSDLEHFALQILVDHSDGGTTPTGAANDLSEQFEEIMIDEYQDSNLVQEYILTSISRERKGQPNLFMVGDVKQSIYKFRLARPELFMEKYNTYTEEDSKAQKIELSKNFRSRDEVLSSVNHIFHKIMRESLGGIEYTDKVALYTGASFPEQEEPKSNQTELILVNMNMDDTELSEEENETAELTNREVEARAIAAKIKQMMKEEFQVTSNGTLRKMRYSDIVILLRTMSNWSETFVEQLLAEGIPCYSDTQTGYFQTLEVKTILNYLRVLDNPKQDIPMMAVLYSPIGKLTSTELGLLRTSVPLREHDGKPCSLYDAARYCLKSDNNILAAKLTLFFERYDLLRAKCDYLSVHELIQEIYQVTGYDLYVYAMPGGEQRRSNLNMLISHAVTFEQSSYHGLFQFIRYVERLLKYEIDYGEASSVSENDNAVRIMSIHKSKGLEFPVVFLGGMGKTFNNMDAREKIVFHPDYGIGPECIDVVTRTKIPTLMKRAIQKKLVLDNLGEELRILYVALTRAKEKLIMIGTVKDAEKELQKWGQTSSISEEQMMYQTLAKATNYFSFVGPASINDKTIALSTIQLTQLESLEEEKQIGLTKKEEDLSAENFVESKNEELRKKLMERLDYEYPYKKQANLPIKTTVSELKKLGDDVDDELTAVLREIQEETTALVMEEPTIPAFLKQETELKGANRGTLIHKILECIEFNKVHTYDHLKCLVDNLITDGILEEGDIKRISLRQLVPFLQSPICERIRIAEAEHKFYKEQQFVIGIEANFIQDDYQGEDIVLIQGVIDAFFEEDDGFVLLDYKTDRIEEGEEDVLVKRYHKQLDYYAVAIERMYNKPIKEKLIYSFALQKTIGLV